MRFYQLRRINSEHGSFFGVSCEGQIASVREVEQPNPTTALSLAHGKINTVPYMTFIYMTNIATKKLLKKLQKHLTNTFIYHTSVFSCLFAESNIKTHVSSMAQHIYPLHFFG